MLFVAMVVIAHEASAREADDIIFRIDGSETLWAGNLGSNLARMCARRKAATAHGAERACPAARRRAAP